MPRLIVDAGKDHRPRHVAGTAPQLRLDEIGDADQKDADRRRCRTDVADRQQRNFVLSRKIPDRQRRADQAAVKRHAAEPQLEDFQRMGEEIVRLIKNHLAEASADDDADGEIKHQVGDALRARPRRIAPQPVVPDQGAHIEPAEGKAADIGKRIPADRKRPDMERHRIDDGIRNIRNDGKCHGGSKRGEGASERRPTFRSCCDIGANRATRGARGSQLQRRYAETLCGNPLLIVTLPPLLPWQRYRAAWRKPPPRASEPPHRRPG